MSTANEANRATTEKLEAEKKATDDAAAAAAAAASAWPIGGYNMFIPLLFISVLTVPAMCVDVSTICLVHASLVRNQYVSNFVNAMVVIISWINLIRKLPIYSAFITLLIIVTLKCLVQRNRISCRKISPFH
jgi:hypothetical protein